MEPGLYNKCEPASTSWPGLMPSSMRPTTWRCMMFAVRRPERGHDNRRHGCCVHDSEAAACSYGVNARTSSTRNSLPFEQVPRSRTFSRRVGGNKSVCIPRHGP